MEKFLLRQKWIGFMAVVLFSLFVAVRTSSLLNEAYITFAPTVSQEVDHFLPVTFKNGEIVFPRDALIERSIGTGNQQFKIVLDTRVKDLNISNLTTGIYVTRDKFYSYDARKGEVKIQSLEKMPDMELTSADVKTFLTQFGSYVKPVSMFAVLVSFLIYIGIVVLIYTVIMHWLFKRLYGADFALTLRTNTLAYLILFGISLSSGITFGIIVTILIMLASNYLANILLGNKK